MAESLYLRKNSNYGRDVEPSDIYLKSKKRQQYINNFFSIDRKEWDKIGPTRYIAHSKIKEVGRGRGI